MKQEIRRICRVCSNLIILQGDLNIDQKKVIDKCLKELDKLREKLES